MLGGRDDKPGLLDGGGRFHGIGIGMRVVLVGGSIDGIGMRDCVGWLGKTPAPGGGGTGGAAPPMTPGW